MFSTCDLQSSLIVLKAMEPNDNAVIINTTCLNQSLCQKKQHLFCYSVFEAVQLYKDMHTIDTIVFSPFFLSLYICIHSSFLTNDPPDSQVL